MLIWNYLHFLSLFIYFFWCKKWYRDPIYSFLSSPQWWHFVKLHHNQDTAIGTLHESDSGFPRFTHTHWCVYVCVSVRERACVCECEALPDFVTHVSSCIHHHRDPVWCPFIKLIRKSLTIFSQLNPPPLKKTKNVHLGQWFSPALTGQAHTITTYTVTGGLMGLLRVN